LVAGCGLVRQGLPPRDTSDAGPDRAPLGRADAAPVDGARVPDAGADARVVVIDPPSLLGVGATCERDGDCASSHCVDAVCCTSSCSGICEACDVAGSLGTCVPATGAPRGNRPPCVGEGTACAGRCDGEQGAYCRYPAGETECARASCAAGLATARAVCSGSGVCLPPTMVSCAPFTCSGAICAGGCSASSPCMAGNFCNGGRCLPLGVAGATCTAGNQCQSGFCAGVCCNRACTGPCESCNRPGQAGTCGTIPLDGDLDNCGSCRSRCSTNHIRATCMGGSCLGACDPGFADCNGSKRNDGCEVGVASDPQNCGGCGIRCPGTRCLGGACEKIEFEFSFVGPVGGKTCISLDEPADPDFWSDNYLCTQRDFGLKWSIAGELPGMVCTQIVEPADPHFWGDNFLCAPVDYGLRWSFVGPIPDMRCTLVDEPSDPSAWTDNYLCAPP
jgi:hypothetical protein